MSKLNTTIPLSGSQGRPETIDTFSWGNFILMRSKVKVADCGVDLSVWMATRVRRCVYMLECRP